MRFVLETGEGRQAAVNEPDYELFVLVNAFVRSLWVSLTSRIRLDPGSDEVKTT